MDEKGSIEMKNVSVVEVLNDDLFGKHSFQVITTCEDKKVCAAAHCASSSSMHACVVSLPHCIRTEYEPRTSLAVLWL